MKATDFIETCQDLAHDAIDVRERLEEVDGDVMALTDEEKQAFTIAMKQVGAMSNAIDNEALKEQAEDSDDDSDDGNPGRGMFA